MEARLSFDDKHEIIYTYAADGRKLRAEYRINNFAVVDRDDEFGEMDDIGLPLSDVATFGLRDTMAAGGGIIDLPDVPPFTTLTTRDYCGNYIYRNGVLERILTGSGKQGNRFESESSTIYWNPLQGLCTTNNNCLSPTTMLDYEAQHCVNYDKNPQNFLMI